MAVLKGADRATDRLLRLLDTPGPKGQTILGRLDAISSETGRPVHAELLRILTHLSYSNETARQVWSGYQIHRATLERKLGRDVGPRVALFDYLLNVDRRLSNPKIIELSDFERTERSASTDHLTGLFNRAYFDATLKKEINRCRRYGQMASVILMDLDDFKRINDAHGHPTGDAVLKDVGRLLIQRVRDIDIAARYGGEEFGIILPETRRMSAFVVAERIRSEIERFFKRKSYDGREARITLSGGVASFPDDADSHEAVVGRADEALYRAKRSGKNRVEIFYREKRRTSRIRLESQGVRVTLEPAAGTAEPGGGSSPVCRALNISEGGMLMETTRRLEPGQTVQIRLPMGPDGEINLSGEVVRLEEKTDGRRRKLYDAAVRFRFGRRSLPNELTRFLRASSAAGA